MTQTNRGHSSNGSVTPTRSSTTSFLTATTLVYAIGAGITAAAGTRLALQLILDEVFTLLSFPLGNPKGSPWLFLVTTSSNWHWVIYAPAAFLGCGSRLSGFLSGIEPWFSVTRYSHGRPIPYHRQLMGQKLEWFIAARKHCDSLSYYESPKQPKGYWFKSNKCDAPAKVTSVRMYCF